MSQNLWCVLDSDDNTRRLKHYIIALYRSIGSHLKSKVSFKSGLDADTFHVQSGFSKNRLAFVKGAFCTPEVWLHGFGHFYALLSYCDFSVSIISNFQFIESLHFRVSFGLCWIMNINMILTSRFYLNQFWRYDRHIIPMLIQ